MYPIYRDGAKSLNRNVYVLKADENNNFLPVTVSSILTLYVEKATPVIKNGTIIDDFIYDGREKSVRIISNIIIILFF